MFYTAIVVSNSDDSMTGIIEVYVPVIMAKQKKNDATPIKKVTRNQFNLLNDDIDEKSVSSVNTVQMNTIPAYPHAYRSEKHGIQIIPEVGDEVLVYFKDDNYSIAYYQYANAYKKGNSFDYGSLIDDSLNSQSPEKYVDHKILLKTKSDHILAFNDTEDSNGVILKAGGKHKVHLTTTDTDSSVKIETENGHSMLLDDINSGMFFKTKGDHALLLDDIEGGINLRTSLGFRVTLDDLKMRMQLVSPKGMGLEFDDITLKLRVDAQQTEVTAYQRILVSSKNMLDIESLSKMSMHSAQIETKADAKYSVESPVLELKSTGQATIDSKGTCDIKGQMITLDGQMISLGNGASSQVLKGTEFLTMFNTHTHTCPPMGGPSSPPIVPLTPSVLSTNVFVK